jgi:hypothetical protein
MELNDKQVNEIIDFINRKYTEEIPRPVKFVVRRKTKKIQTLQLEDFPESFRKCTIEQLILILKDAQKNDKLKF